MSGGTSGLAAGRCRAGRSGRPSGSSRPSSTGGAGGVRRRCGGRPSPVSSNAPPFAGEGDSILTARPGPRRGTGLGPTGSSVPPSSFPPLLRTRGTRHPGKWRPRPPSAMPCSVPPAPRDEVRILYGGRTTRAPRHHDAGHHHAGLAHDEPGRSPTVRSSSARVASASDEQGPAGEGAGVWCLPHRPPRVAGELPPHRLNVVPGHEVIGEVVAVGDERGGRLGGQRVGRGVAAGHVRALPVLRARRR